MLYNGAGEIWLKQNAHTFSPHTQAVYMGAVRGLGQFAPENFKDVRQEHIEQYLQHLFDSGLTARTCNTYLFGLKSFFRWAESIIDHNPAKNIKRYREMPPKQCVLSEAEYRGIFAVCRNDERLIIQLLANTGLRSAEMRNLRPENISRNGEFLHIVGKRSRKRSIPLNKTAKHIVKETNFFNLLKNYRKPDSLTCLCRSIRRRNRELPQFSPHAFRHLFATKMLRRGCDIYTLSRILGHKNITTTAQYLHLIDDDLEGATNCLDE